MNPGLLLSPISCLLSPISYLLSPTFQPFIGGGLHGGREGVALFVVEEPQALCGVVEIVDRAGRVHVAAARVAVGVASADQQEGARRAQGQQLVVVVREAGLADLLAEVPGRLPVREGDRKS